jgi:Nucleotidyltransferase domain.
MKTAQSLDEKYKRKIINLIIALEPRAKIYLFGSQASGTQIQGSDIDIAIDTGKPMRRADVGEILDILNETNIPYKFDVVDLHAVPEKMQETIKKEGILWKS